MITLTRPFKNMITGDIVRLHPSTDHPQSSYGLPVWVDDNGSDYGQCDLWPVPFGYEPLPPDVEVIRELLHTLNSMNWGLWPALPDIGMGYSVHQYDCDGKQATTITLDKPISDEDYGIKNERRFKVGGKRGHLNKYRLLR